MRLTDKVALVTGGGSGIGEAICLRFAEEGAAVAVADIVLEKAEAVARAIAAAGGNALALCQDVTREDGWPEAVQETIRRFGKLNIVVNNAGIVTHGSAEDADFTDWKRTLQVNLDGVFLGTRQAIRAMKAGGGSIINMSSIEGIIGDPLIPAYNASKGAVRIFTKSAALHCAAQGYNIRVNSIHPGYILTPMVVESMADMPEAEAEELRTRILSAIPMGQLGEPRDVANGALFLASDESKYMTGSELVIDGGYTAQ